MREWVYHMRAQTHPDILQTNYHFDITLYRQLMNQRHDHDFYEITYVIEGSVTQEINWKNSRQERGCLCILRPGDSHKLADQVPRTNMLAFSIARQETAPFLAAYHCDLSLLDEPPVFYLTPAQQEAFRAEYSRIPLLDYPQRITHMRILLGQVLHYYMYSISNTEDARLSRAHFLDALKKFNQPEYIREGVPALLRLSNFSHAQLCRIMKRMLDTTPQEYVIDLRLNLAFQMIQSTNLPLAAIAEQVGYSSLSHFITIFTQKYHITPSMLRKKA